MFSSRAICNSRPCIQPLIRRHFSTSSARCTDFTHAVIGGGVIGLAIARQLQARDGASTILLEKHSSVGTETSSRNSEVIHAGLYYGTDSLKTKLCLRGKEMLYRLCEEHAIPHRRTGKWIVAQDEQQMEALRSVHDFPDVRAEAGVLESPSTGIVDSHALMQYLQFDYEDRGGLCAFRSAVTHVSPLDFGHAGWEITTSHPDPNNNNNTQTTSTITADTIINSAGLHAVTLQNQILPPSRQKTPFYAKGSYYTYTAPHPRPKTLIYPAPVPGHAGLGTHLTLDMSGHMRFGPDVQWTQSPTDYEPNTSMLARAMDDIVTYLPGVRREALAPDYVGIRPKLGRFSATSGEGFQDFYIVKEEGFGGFVNLLAMESPGLTSCLAVAEEVEGLLYRR
ncbi:FAD dependent oxidoreductase [Decorospora gaudefroyi]|uniref:L-2-hydroxyglutarate dehydrogenase, mitochondrial n=1 Tax=Decorospora gaudefroyi TaxID=184978 RepID=A0A6A5KKC6_9PLEO|nr:FAD dependent oxidoreductase [Decorospora gaudefroyi]